MPNYDLGTAEGKIVIDGSGAATGVGQANQALGQLGSQGQQTATTLQNTGKALLGVGGLALAGFGIAVNSAANFEKQLSGIEAVSGATEAQMESIREKALELGADTKYSASEAALGMEELIKAGVSVEDTLNGAADATVALAAAGEIELAEAATIASNAMNVFNLEANDLAHVADVIAGTANASAVDVRELGMSLQQSGAVANLVGLSFDDLALAIAAMGNAGIRGSDAGTSIKTFLSNLQPTTEKQISLAKELGILTEDNTNRFFDEEGQLKSLADVSQILNDALSGMTDQQKTLALETLFGSDAIRAAAIIAEEGAAGFATLGEEVAKVGAEEVAEQRMDNLAGSIEQLKGSIETYLIKAGTPFLSSIRGFVDALTGLVNFFGGLPPSIQGLISKIVLFSGVLFVGAGATSYFLGTFIKFANTLKAFTSIFKITKGVGALAKAFQLLRFALLGHPIILIITAVVALGFALYKLYKHSETFRKAVDKLWQTVQKVWDAILDFFKDLPGKIAGYLDDLRDKLVEVWDEVYETITEVLDDIIDAVVDFVGNLVSSIGNVGGDIVSAIGGFFSSLPGMIGGFLAQALATVVNFLIMLPERFAYFLGLVVGAVIQFGVNLLLQFGMIGAQLLVSIASFLMQLPGMFLNFLTQVLMAVITWGATLITTILGIGVNFVTTLINALLQLPSWLPGFLADIVGKIINFGINIVSEIISIGGRFVSGLINAIINLPSEVAGIISNVVSTVAGFAGDFLSAAGDLAAAAIDGLIGGLGDLAGLVYDAFKNAIGGIGGLVSSAFEKAKSIGSSLWNGFKSGLGIFSPSYIEKAAFAINENVGNSIDQLRNQVRTMQGLSRGIPSAAEDLAMGRGSAARALRLAPAASSGNGATSGGVTVVVEGPLLAVERLEGTQEEAISISRRLADLTYEQLRARGAQNVRLDGVG